MNISVLAHRIGVAAVDAELSLPCVSLLRDSMGAHWWFVHYMQNGRVSYHVTTHEEPTTQPLKPYHVFTLSVDGNHGSGTFMEGDE